MTRIADESTNRPSTALRVAAGIRDAWLIIGIALALLLLLEAFYRGQANVRRLWRDSGDAVSIPADHPYASETWWKEWVQGTGLWRSRYDPYRGLWSEPQSGPHLNIDSLGRRRTVQSSIDPADVRFRIYLFGGSTMFGYTARDAGTIPSQLAELMERRGLRGVEVVNLAQSTFNITQGLSTLALELRDGRIPDVVVFLDGNNEVAPAFQSGRAGAVLNENLLARRFRGLPPSLPGQVVDAFSFIGRLGRAVGGSPDEVVLAAPDASEICPWVADTYLGAASVIEGLGRSFGFDALFFWQPMLATTKKELTSFEQAARAPGTWGPTVAECSRAVDAEAARRGFSAYASLGATFDYRSEAIFIDDYGHVTEAGNRLIAEAILARPLPLIRLTP